MKKAFTLVELVITITILVILSTIAFVSFQSYTKDSRDANRLTSINELTKALELEYSKNGSYPTPETSVNILFSGAMLWTQWVIWSTLWNTLNLSSTLKDPLTQKYYTYSIDDSWEKYSVLMFLENQDLALSPPVLASSEKKIFMKWKWVWVFLDSSNTPLEQLGWTWIDLTQATASYNIYFQNDSFLSWTGNVLKNLQWGLTFWDKLVARWSFDTLSGASVVDDSGNKNSLLVLTGTLTTASGVTWNAFQAWGTNCLYTKLYNSFDTNSKNFTINVFIKTNSSPLVNGMPFGLYGADTTTGTWYQFIRYHKNYSSSGDFDLLRGLTPSYPSSNINTTPYKVMDRLWMNTSNNVNVWEMNTIAVSWNNYAYYRNGEKLFEKKMSGAFLTPQNLTLFTGCWNVIYEPVGYTLATVVPSGVISYNYNGLIDNLSLHKRTMSDDEIKIMYSKLK